MLHLSKKTVRSLLGGFALVASLSMTGAQAGSFCTSHDVNAGPIWGQGDADAKCPGVCGKSGDIWNGQWNTTQPGKMSVCGCMAQSQDVSAGGPIWNNDDAKSKCTKTCSNAGSTWNGQWVTTVPNKMSVCGCKC